MRTDPRAACANERETLLWALLHDAVAHPLMALTGYCALSLRFHNFTSKFAWPRVSATPLSVTKIATAFGYIDVTELADGVYSIQHPKVKHAFVTNATMPIEAAYKAVDWFQTLSQEFGGDFTLDIWR